MERKLDKLAGHSLTLPEKIRTVRAISLELDAFFSLYKSRSLYTGKDRRGRPDLLERCHLIAKRRDDFFTSCVESELLRAGIRFASAETIVGSAHFGRLKYDFEHVVFPALTPLVVDFSHPFPQLQSCSLNLAVVLERAGHLNLGLVQIPGLLRRCYLLVDQPMTLMLVEQLIGLFIDRLFSDPVSGIMPFRLIRTVRKPSGGKMSDLWIQGKVVRLEIQAPVLPFARDALMDQLRLDNRALFTSQCPLDLTFLSAVENRIRLSESFD